MIKKIFPILFLITGCATERIVPVEVRVPVPVPCVFDDVPEPEAQKKGANIYDKVRALIVEIKQRKIYEEKLRAQISVCKSFDPHTLDQ